MNKLKGAFGVKDEEKGAVDGALQDMEDGCGLDLTWEQRFWGFVICIGVGTVFGIMSVIFLFLVAFTSFALFYTFANILYLSSTFFLVGPKSQWEKMADDGRYVASIVFVVAMILTIIVAVVLQSGILALLCVIVQSAALLWYTLSYIPGARTVVSSFCGALVS